MFSIPELVHRWRIFLTNIEYLIVYLLLTALFIASTISNYGTSSLLMKLLLSALALSSILYAKRSPLDLKPNSTSGWLVLSIPFYICLSLLWTDNLAFGIMKFVHFLILYIPLFLFANNAKESISFNSIVKWGWIAIGSGAVLSLWVLISAPIHLGSGYISVSIPFLGRIVTYATVLVIIYIFSGLGSRKLYPILLLHIISLSIISFRAGLIAVGSVSLLVIVIYGWQKNIYSGVYMLVALLGGIGVGFMISDNLGFRTSWVTEAISGNGINDISVTVRLDAIRLAFEKWLESPIIGVGIGGFNDATSLNSFQSIIKYPHNFVMEILCEYGVLGVTIFAATLVSFYSNFEFKRIINGTAGNTKFGLFVVMITAGILALFSKDISHNIIVLLIGYLLAVSSSLRMNNRCGK